MAKPIKYGTVELIDMEFFAYHGVFDEEQKVGNKYSIDIKITADLSEAAQTDRLKNTVNYADLYNIAAAEMQKKARLLEHIAQNIILQIRDTYPHVQSIEIAVSKFNPPVGGVCARSRVTLVG